MNRLQQHERWMREALREAERALQEGEVPVGAVVVANNHVVGRGHNRVEALQDATAHAEILAITAASNTLFTWRLDQADLYVTLEPCIMCAGAVLNARLRRVVYGASDPQVGACGSVFNIVQDPRHRWHVDVVSGILAERCSELLNAFFQEKRRLRKRATKEDRSTSSAGG